MSLWTLRSGKGLEACAYTFRPALEAIAIGAASFQLGAIDATLRRDRRAADEETVKPV